MRRTLQQRPTRRRRGDAGKVWAFAVSLAGMVVSSIYTLVLSKGAEMMGVGGTVFTVVIWAFSIFLLLYARAQATRGVLK